MLQCHWDRTFSSLSNLKFRSSFSLLRSNQTSSKKWLLFSRGIYKKRFRQKYVKKYFLKHFSLIQESFLFLPPFSIERNKVFRQRKKIVLESIRSVWWEQIIFHSKFIEKKILIMPWRKIFSSPLGEFDDISYSFLWDLERISGKCG